MILVAFVAGWLVGWAALGIMLLGYAIAAERRKLRAADSWHGVVGPEASELDR